MARQSDAQRSARYRRRRQSAHAAILEQLEALVNEVQALKAEVRAGRMSEEQALAVLGENRKGLEAA